MITAREFPISQVIDDGMFGNLSRLAISLCSVVIQTKPGVISEGRLIEHIPRLLYPNSARDFQCAYLNMATGLPARPSAQTTSALDVILGWMRWQLDNNNHGEYVWSFEQIYLAPRR